MRPVLQAEAAECGLACLAMVSEAHGQRLDLATLRSRFGTSLKGATLQQLMSQAAELGFATRPVRLELEGLSALRRPCLLHWDLDHFVVLAAVGPRGATVLDPAVGERRLSREALSRHFTGVALEIEPKAGFVPEAPPPRLKLAQLTGRVRGLRRSLAQIALVAAVLELFALVAPLFGQLVIDGVVAGGDRDLLGVLVLGFGLLLVVQTAIGLARSWMVLVLGQTLALQWMGNVFAHLVRLPVAFFERRHLGDIVSRVDSVGAIQRTLTTAVVESLIDGVMAVAALAVMLLYAPSLAAVAVVAVLVYGGLRAAAYRPLREATAERLVVAARESTHFLETLRAMTPLKLFGREEDRRARWQNLLVDVQNRDVRTARMTIGFAAASAFVAGAETIAVLALGARLVMDGPGASGGGFTLGMLLAFLAYQLQFSGRVRALIDHAVELRMLGLHAERLADIALAEPERDGAPGVGAAVPSNDLAHLPPTLALRDVSFRYGPGEPWILRHADFAVEAHTSVAVTGASGSGKTTLLKILLGLLEPTEGEVLYGGVPVARLGLANVRRRLGTVMQEDVLLTGSLLDNITFFDDRPDAAWAEQCARLAQVHDDVVRMPMGYQTLVGDLGSGLSGGQRQRILLARALYKRPAVLALDEATSHLDLAAERAVAAALARMPLTRIVIAHRPETIAGAQRRVLLKDGQVTELLRAVPAAGERDTDPAAG